MTNKSLLQNMKISTANLMTSHNKSASDWPTGNRNRKSSFHSSVMTSPNCDITKSSSTNHSTSVIYDKFFNNQQRNEIVLTHHQSTSSAMLRQRLHQRKVNEKQRSRQLKPLTVVKQQERTFCAALANTENEHSPQVNSSSLYEDLYKKKKIKSNTRLKQKKENSHKQHRIPVYSMSMLHVNEDALLRHHPNQSALNGIRICNFLPPRSMWSTSSLSGGAREQTPNSWDPSEDYSARGDSSSSRAVRRQGNKKSPNEFIVTNTKPPLVTSETHHVKQRRGSGRGDLSHPSDVASKQQQRHYLYADPYSPAQSHYHFQQRISELNQLQLDTIKFEKCRKSKRKKNS